MDDRDQETLARFERRFAAIEREIPKAPGLRELAGRPTSPLIASSVLAVVAIVAIALVVGVSLASRTSEPGLVGGSPSVPPTASPSSVAADSPVAGKVICGAPPVAPTPPASLTCDRAVKAALTVIPAGHISSIRFAYGGYCPIWARCAWVPPTNAYVVVAWSDRTPDVVVGVAVDEGGNLTISGPEPVPTRPPG